MADSLVEADSIATAKALLEKAGDKLVLPVDGVVADAFRRRRQPQVVARRRASPPAGASWTSAPRRSSYFRDRRWPGPRRWSGTGRWACSRCANFAKGTIAVAEMLADCDAVDHHRRRRFGGGGPAGRPGGQDDPHLHRRRRLPRDAGGQRVARRGGVDGQMREPARPLCYFTWALHVVVALLTQS